MEEVVVALRELAASNNKLIEKLDELKQESIKIREHKEKRAEEIAKKSVELDIKFLMEKRGWKRHEAIERLNYYNFDMCKVYRNGAFFMWPGWMKRVILHYEYKKNLEIIQKW